MLHALTPWTKLTRFGIPQFRVIRRDLYFNATTYPVGEQLPTEVACHRHRVRQMYEQHLIEPIPETITARPPKGVPASEAQIPAAVLEQEAMQSIDAGLPIDLPEIQMPVVEEVAVTVPSSYLPVPAAKPIAKPKLFTNKTNKTNKRR